MSKAVAGIALTVAITAATGGLGLLIGVAGMTLGSVAFSTGAVALLGTASYLMQPNIKTPEAGAAIATTAAPANGSRAIPIAQSVPPRQFVYGQVRTGGVLLFEDTNNPYLLMVVALSDGEIDGVVGVYLAEESIPYTDDGQAATGSRLSGNFTVETTHGETDQTASALMLANFPDSVDTTFRQQGVARAVASLNYGTDATNHSALWGSSIALNYLVRGMRVYDPRDGYQIYADPTTWQYSANPALCVAHALTHAWGIALQYASIDWASVAEAANVCDTLVTKADGTLAAIFSAAGIFQGGADFGGQISDMLSAFRGGLTYSNGQYQIVADESTTSVATILDDDILEFKEFQFAGETRSRFNTISAVYYDADDTGQRTTTTPYELTYEIAQEGLRETSITLPFTAQSHSAQIIAFRELMEGRDGRQITLRLRDWALWMQPKKDVITISSVEAPMINGTYRVKQIDMTDVGVIVTLRGYSTDPYINPTSYLN